MDEKIDYDCYFRKGYETKEQVDLMLKYNPPQTTLKLSDPDNPNQPLYVDEPKYYSSGLHSPNDYLHPVITDDTNRLRQTMGNYRHVPERKLSSSGQTFGKPSPPTRALYMGATLHTGIIGDPDYAFSGWIPEDVLNLYLEREIDMVGGFWWSFYYFDNNTHGYGIFVPDSIENNPPYFNLNLKPTTASSPDPGIRIYINPVDGENVHLNDGSNAYPFFINIADETPGGGRDYFINNILTTGGLISSSSPFQIQQDLAMFANIKPKIIAGLSIYTFAAPSARYNGSVNPQRPSDNLPIGPTDDPAEWLCIYSKMIIDFYHQFIDADTIFQGFIYEACDASFNQFAIPNYVLEEFGFCDFVEFTFGGGTPEWVPVCTSGSAMVHTDHTGAVSRFFDNQNMLYSSPYPAEVASDYTNGYMVMDITKPETQMWLYFWATKMIDAGFESVFFGDIFTMVWNDGPNYSAAYIPSTPYGNGYSITWQLMQKVRAYAATHARRGTVICMGTAPINREGFYYDPSPGSPLPTWQRQLILDAHRNKIPVNRRFSNVACANGNGQYDGASTQFWGADFCAIPYNPSVFPQQMNGTHFRDDNVVAGAIQGVDWNPHILYDNQGGLHPQGWFCLQVPFWIGFDSTQIYSGNAPFGCNHTPGVNWIYYNDYMFDDMDWFALQDKASRDAILQYLYFRIKCINPYAHFAMLGRTNLFADEWNNRVDHTSWFRANDGGSGYVYDENLNGKSGQESMIKALWYGLIPIPKIWMYYNFTIENVSNAATRVLGTDGITTVTLIDIGASSSLLFTGNNMIFFISDDNYIHGYIQVNENQIGGTWLTVSPTYAAEAFYGSTDATQLVSNQVAAKSNLVAVPDSSMLLYIGQDDKLHGFTIQSAIDPWHYRYFDFMNDQPVTAISDLIFVGNDQLYFKGIYEWYYPDGSGLHLAQELVCSFIKAGGVWTTFIPAFYVHSATGYPVLSQQSVDGKIFHFNEFNMICYLGTDGLLYGYQFTAPATCEYLPLVAANNLLLTNTVAITGSIFVIGNRVYFVGRSTVTHRTDLYCLFNDGSLIDGWALICPAAQSLELYDTLLPDISSPRVDSAVASSPDGSRIAYFGVFPDGAMNVVVFNFSGGNNYKYAGLVTDYTVNGEETGLQFTDNNTLFFIDSTSGMVQKVAYQEDFCAAAEAVMQTLWPEASTYDTGDVGLSGL